MESLWCDILSLFSRKRFHAPERNFEKKNNNNKKTIFKNKRGAQTLPEVLRAAGVLLMLALT